MQNESETEFHRVYKVAPTQQLTELTHLLLFLKILLLESFINIMTKQTKRTDIQHLNPSPALTISPGTVI